MSKTMRFKTTGTIRVSGRKITDFNGDICGYKTKDGSTVRLVIALEVEDKNGKFKYLPTDYEMSKIGFEIESYEDTSFE